MKNFKRRKGHCLHLLLGYLLASPLMATGSIALMQEAEIQSVFTFSVGVSRNTQKQTANNIQLNGQYACGFALKENATNKKVLAFGLERDRICYAQIFSNVQGVAIGQGAFFIAADGQWIDKNKVSSFRDSSLFMDPADASESKGIASNGQLIGQTKPKATDVSANQAGYVTLDGHLMPAALSDSDKVFVLSGAAQPADMPPQPANVPVLEPAAPAAVTPLENSSVPQPALTQGSMDVANVTAQTVISAIQSGKLVTTSPDDAKALESQLSVNIVGEVSGWKRFSEGFAMSPVQLSDKNGIICRFMRNNALLIGNVYKNNRANVAPLGVPICRASADDGTVQVEKDTFEMLNKRGSQKVVWMPITSTISINWETGYRLSAAGKTVMHNGQAFQVAGICRMPKADDPTSYHIGRAVMDNNGEVHCYLKKAGGQVDLTEDKLQGVDVLIKDSAAKSIKPATAINTTISFSG